MWPKDWRGYKSPRGEKGPVKWKDQISADCRIWLEDYEWETIANEAKKQNVPVEIIMSAMLKAWVVSQEDANTLWYAFEQIRDFARIYRLEGDR